MQNPNGEIDYADKSTEPDLSIAMSALFSDFLLQSVDEVVGDLLGARVREALCDCLMVQCGLSMERIPDHLEEFQRFLDENLGKARERPWQTPLRSDSMASWVGFSRVSLIMT